MSSAPTTAAGGTRSRGLPAGLKPVSEIPAPPLPGPLQSWLGVAWPVRARLAMRRRYGPIFRTNDVLAGETIHVADRALVERMFKWKPAQFNVGEPRRIMEPVTGPASILLLDGRRHMRMRKLMLPPFHGEAIAKYASLIEEITKREIARWRVGETVRTRGVAQAITLEVIIRAVFGITDADRVAELKTLLPRLSSVNPIIVFEPARKDLGRYSPWGRFIRNRDRVDKMLYEEIGARRRENGAGPARTDVLTLLLAARDEDGRPLTDQELRDELITLLLAGHETTANSIGWAFERLLRTPHALERLTAEVRSGEGEEYMDAVIKESMRVRPVVSEVFRAPTEPTEMGGYLIEPGTQMAASILLIQYDAELYGPDPLAFRPERFLDGVPESYSWIPFGGGVRRCLGASFAELEMKVVIGAILRHARLRTPRARGEKALFRGVTLVPRRGGEAVVEQI